MVRWIRVVGCLACVSLTSGCQEPAVTPELSEVVAVPSAQSTKVTPKEVPPGLLQACSMGSCQGLEKFLERETARTDAACVAATDPGVQDSLFSALLDLRTIGQQFGLENPDENLGDLCGGARADGKPCDDHNPCTQGEHYEGLTCSVATNVTLCPEPTNPCLEAVRCVPVTLCSGTNPPKADGTPCGEGRICTAGDCACPPGTVVCRGQCVSSPPRALWRFVGIDGCGDATVITYLTSPTSKVELGHANDYPVWKDLYDCDGDGVGEVPSSVPVGQFAVQPFFSGNCLYGCEYGHGFQSAAVTKIAEAACLDLPPGTVVLQ
jgi:hypothetical protein